MSADHDVTEGPLYAALAGLFGYPDHEFAGRVREIQGLLEKTCAAAAAELREFTEFVARASIVELEELYTRSFDVQAVTTLDLGYVLFGDDYKRGEVLVNLSAEHREAGVDCGSELPDHLPNVLRLLDAMQNRELREELVQKIVAPALRRIIGEFEPDRLQRKSAVYEKHHKTLIERSERYGIIYQRTLCALYAVLKQEFALDAGGTPPMRRESRFLNSIGTEMRMECNKGTCHGRTG
ncbi:MAG: nitrate reductase molybdenum cofactor assembly chaperone [Candidatus Krumholzibacteriia bacterium]